MSVAEVLWSLYLALNAAVAAGALALLVMEKLAPQLSGGTLLQLHYAAATALFFSVAVQSLLPRDLIPGASALSADLLALTMGSVGISSSDPSSMAAGTFDASSLARVWIATALALLASGVFVMSRDIIRLRALLRRSHLVRSVGRVRIWVHDEVPGPLSWWRPGRAHVVIPSFLLQDASALRIALAHELQHHRQRDTLWLHLFAVLRVSCALNPFIHVWARATRRAQEFACDEAVIARGRCSPHAYAHCLLDVAGRRSSSLVGVTSCLIGFGDPNSLRRRIDKMLDTSQGRWARQRMRMCVLGFCAFMTMAAYAGSAVNSANTGARKNVWPVEGTVLSGFGKHRGIDIAAAPGSPVRAYSAGIVLSIEATRGCPGRVQIRHESLLGTYCNLSAVTVTAGQAVDAAAVIGTVASPPPGVKAHLHFELSEETFVDPEARLPRMSHSR